MDREMKMEMEREMGRRHRGKGGRWIDRVMERDI